MKKASGRPVAKKKGGAAEVARLQKDLRAAKAANKRLSKTLSAQTEELAQALERETAMSEVLGVMSSQPGELRPVFDMILNNALRLCEADMGNIHRIEDDRVRVVATRGALPDYEAFLRDTPAFPFAPDGPLATALRAKEPYQIADERRSPAYAARAPGITASVELGGSRTHLFVPMLRDEGAVVGVIDLYRREVRPFEPKHVDLLANFGKQAAIAIENARLLTELRQSLDRQTATAEVLQVINSSPGDLAPVFDAVLDKALHLCAAAFGLLHTYDGERFRALAIRGISGAAAEPLREWVPDPGSALEQLVRGGRVVHISDVVDTEAYRSGVASRLKLVALTGARTALWVALRQDDALLGAFVVYRQEVRPFSEKDVALLENFAAQAVIAMENARLINETRAALEQQTATSEVLGAISSSPGDLAPVFEAMLANALRLCEAKSGVLLRYDGDAFETEGMMGVPADFEQFWRHNRLRMPPETNMGRMVAAKEVVHDLDLAASPGYLQRLPVPVAGVEVGGCRTSLHVPMLKEGEVVGAFIIWRNEVRAFTDKQVALIENFAAQAVIAVENARLLSELRESLERQTATAEVLRVISSSPDDLAPVFEAILENTVRICDAKFSVLWQRAGEAFEAVAVRNLPPAMAAFIAHSPALPLPESMLEQVMLSGHSVYEEDAAASAAYAARVPAMVANVELGGARSVLVVPMVKDGELVGAITVFRQEVRPFTDKQVTLIENFAAQAVIAIENARLLSELRQRTADLQEALEYQTATSDVLKVISRSAFDLDAVLQTVVVTAVRLCRAGHAVIFRNEGGEYRWAAGHGLTPEYDRIERDTVIRPGPGTIVGRAALEGRTVQFADAWTDPLYEAKDDARAGNVRAMLGVPLLRENAVIGVIGLARSTTEPFSEREVQLVTTFADQAVIAIENARLFGDLRESLDRQTATSEVLGVISRSPGDLGPVFETILDNALRLCDADTGNLYRLEGGRTHLTALRGALPAYEAFLRQRQPQPVDPDGNFARAIRQKLPVRMADLGETPEYAARIPGIVAAVDIGGMRSSLLVPMVSRDTAIGFIAIYRREVRPFNDKEIALVENFAAQAVIAIENARLLTELRNRTEELTESLEQQTASADVLRVISASPGQVEPVFQAMLENATRLCETSAGTMYLFDGDAWLVATTVGMAPGFTPGRTAGPLRPHPETGLGRVMRTLQTVHIPDLPSLLDQLAEPVAMAAVAEAGVRSLLVVPMLKKAELIGAISLYRGEVRPFTEKQIDLVENFAAQAVIAIENARLLTELRGRTAELSESLRQQTATSEVLGVISSSPGNLEPVFDTILENAMRLCDADMGQVYRLEGDTLHVVGRRGALPAYEAFLKERGAFRSMPNEPPAIAMRQKSPLMLADARATDAYRKREAGAVAAIELGGVRTILLVPMLRDGEAIGVILIYRHEVRPFGQKQIALVENFAAQAVIAIENARLLAEIRARTDELARSVGELTALGDVTQAVNSTLDLQTVLTTIVSNSVQLSQTDAGAIYVYEEDTAAFRLRATFGMDESLIAAIGQQQINLGTSGIGEAASRRTPQQIPDLAAEPVNPVTGIILKAGFRALLVIPLLGRDHIVGALVVRRRAPGEFPPSTIELLQTFAAQSVIAIQNARLFHEIEEKSRELAIASRHKSQFLANMSHELRTPLNAILGYTELILDDIYGAAPPRMREVLERVQTNGKHLLGLINDVLDLSKIEAGELVIERADFSLREMLQGVYVAVEPLAATKQLALRLDVPPGLPVACGDARRVSQVVLNLVGNAIKFTDAGAVEISAAAANGSLTVAVRDTGPGIDPTDQQKIFEEFQQADNSSTRAKGGTGLGLAISRRIVEMHGGRLWVDSAPGAGSTFSFTLPITQGTSA